MLHLSTALAPFDEANILHAGGIKSHCTFSHGVPPITVCGSLTAVCQLFSVVLSLSVILAFPGEANSTT